MRLLFDSSVLMAHLRGERRATDLLLSVPTTDRLTSVLARIEIEGGMRTGERADVARLFGFMTLVPVSDRIARRAGEHLRRFRASHQGIDLVDYVLAASAEAVGASLSTLNVRHFPMFDELEPAWTENDHDASS